MARGVASTRRGRCIERRSSFGSEPAAARAGRDGSERVAGAGRVRRRSTRARRDSEGSVEPSEPVGEDGDANVRCAGTRTVRRDPSAQSHASEIVQRHRRRRVRTAEVIRGADVEGARPREGERASETRTRRVDERRATRRASTVTARVVRYEGTSMERWTTRARVGDGRRALASATTSDALEKDTPRFFIQIGTGRGIVAERAPSSPPSILRHTARRQKQKSARLASFVSALLRRREKKTTTTKTETRPRRD